MSKVKEIEKQVEAFRDALDGYQPTNNGGGPTRQDQEAAKAAEVLADNIEAILLGAMTEPEYEYAFKVGPSPNYRYTERRFATLQEARDAAYKERLFGGSTSRVTKVEKETR